MVGKVLHVMKGDLDFVLTDLSRGEALFFLVFYVVVDTGLDCEVLVFQDDSESLLFSCVFKGIGKILITQ